jgi:hypothetical protein
MKRALKFPTDGSLGAVDLDNEVFGTRKSDELRWITINLFRLERSDINLSPLLKTKPPDAGVQGNVQ